MLRCRHRQCGAPLGIETVEAIDADDRQGERMSVPLSTGHIAPERGNQLPAVCEAGLGVAADGTIDGGPRPGGRQDDRL